MGSSELNQLRHLDIKIEYYTLKINSATEKLTDEEADKLTIMLARYKLFRQLLVIIEKISQLQEGQIDLEELYQIGGVEGLRRNAKMLKELLETIDSQERRVVGDVEDDGNVILQFNKQLKVLDGKLSQYQKGAV